MKNIDKCNIYQVRLVMGTNYVIKYINLVKFPEIGIPIILGSPTSLLVLGQRGCRVTLPVLGYRWGGPGGEGHITGIGV